MAWFHLKIPGLSIDQDSGSVRSCLLFETVDFAELIVDLLPNVQLALSSMLMKFIVKELRHINCYETCCHVINYYATCCHVI